MGKYKKKRGKLKGIVRAFLAQSVERAAFNRKVVGSRPTGGVFLKRRRSGIKADTGREKSKVA